MQDLVASSGEVADFAQLLHHYLSKCVGQLTVVILKIVKDTLEAVFDLYVLGFCRNLIVECGRAPGPFGDIKGSFYAEANAVIRSYSRLYLKTQV